MIVPEAVLNHICGKYGYSLLVTFLLSFALCLYVPLSSYWHNVNEYAFNAISLLRGFTIPFLLVWTTAFGLVRIVGRFFGVETILLGKHQISVSLPDIVLGTLIFSIWLEGALLSKGLPSVTGATGLYSSTPRLILDSIVWLTIFLVTVIYWRKMTRLSLFMVAAITLLMASGLGDAYLSQEEKIRVYATREQVLQNVKFHPTENVIVIVADAFPTYMAERVLERRKDIVEALEGFLFFRNNLATGGQTSWAIPGILQGAVYEGGDYTAFVERAFSAPDSMPQFFASSGWNAYISSLLPRFCALWEGYTLKDNMVVIQFQLSSPLYISLAFRFMPYIVKQNFEHIVIRQLVSSQIDVPKVEGDSSNSWIANTLTSKLDVNSATPTAHFHHYFGVHSPYLFDARGKPQSAVLQGTQNGLQASSEWELDSFSAFLSDLKKRKMYDGATIIFTADHGDGFRHMSGEVPSGDLPVLLIKPRNSHGPLHFSDKPVSNAYLSSLLKHAVRGTDMVNEFLSDLPQERKLFVPPDSLLNVLGKRPEDLFFSNKVTLNAKQNATVLRSGQRYVLARTKLTAPLAVPAEISGSFVPSGGEGIDFFPGSGDISFDVDCKADKVDLKLSINYAQYRNRDSPGNVSLKLIDINSGSELYHIEQTLPIDRDSMDIPLKLKGLAISKSKQIRIAFRSDSPEDCLYVLHEVRLGKCKK